MDSKRLPGGLGWWRAWWLVTVHRGWLVKAFATQVVPGVAVTGTAVAFLLLRTIPTTAVGILFLAIAASLLVPTFRLYAGARVTARSQPDLYALVERVAERLGVSMPDRVTLIYFPGVGSVAAGFHRHLRIGLPTLSLLNRAQLETLVAHELAPLRYRRSWLVLRLRSIYREEMRAPDTRAVNRERILTRLATFWSTVEDDCDIAAISSGGTATAAQAVATMAVGAREHVVYSHGQRAPNGREGIQDLDDGWRRYLAYGDVGVFGDDDLERVAGEHTSLADAIRRVGDVHSRLADNRVELAPLRLADERRFAQRSLFLLGLSIQLHLRRIRWYTFATAPPQWWIVRAERTVAVVREYEELPADADFAVASTDIGGLRLYAELRLLTDGWRHEHPAVQLVLISPEGERVDLGQLDRDALVAAIVATAEPGA